MENSGSWLILAVILLAVGIGIFFVVRRQRYLKELRDRGWTHNPNPALESVLDLAAPPFGLGFSRSPDEMIIGTTSSGVPFRVFEYDSSGAGLGFRGRVATLALPAPLPDLFICAGRPRVGVLEAATPLGTVAIDPNLSIVAADPRYAADITRSMLAPIAAYGQAGYRVDLSIDGPNLVATNAPKDPDELAAFLDALAPIATAIDGPTARSYTVGPRPPSFGFYGRPDWVLIGQDDSLIQTFGLTTAGMNHATQNVIRGKNDGLPIHAFTHTWQTQRVEVTTDSEGRVQTRTVTDNHSENVAVITLPFVFPQLSNNTGMFSAGKKVEFESEQFNDRFKIRSGDAKFAYDVIHPRMMEFMMAFGAPEFVIGGQLMRFVPPAHDTLTVGRFADFAHEFFGRVPSFVWKNLQIQPPTFRVRG